MKDLRASSASATGSSITPSKNQKDENAKANTKWVIILYERILLNKFKETKKVEAPKISSKALKDTPRTVSSMNQ